MKKFREGLLFLTIMTGKIIADPNCNRLPADYSGRKPSVNWSHCIKKGTLIAPLYSQFAPGRMGWLDGANLNGVHLENSKTGVMHMGRFFPNIVSFHGVQAVGAHFEGSYLVGAQFTYGANLTEANFENANLEKADFIKSNLTKAKLAGANLAGARFTGANLSGSDISIKQLEVANHNLSGTDLSGLNLSKANFAGKNLVGAKLAGANLQWSNITAKQLEEADNDLSGTNLFGLNPSGANLSGKNLNNADLRYTELTGVNFSGATWIDGSKCFQGSIGHCNTNYPATTFNFRDENVAMSWYEVITANGFERVCDVDRGHCGFIYTIQASPYPIRYRFCWEEEGYCNDWKIINTGRPGQPIFFNADPGYTK